MHNFIRGNDKIPGAWSTIDDKVRSYPLEMCYFIYTIVLLFVVRVEVMVVVVVIVVFFCCGIVVTAAVSEMSISMSGLFSQP